MIILIGGVSCTGKTLLAQRLLERHHIPYYSIDHIKMGLYRSGRDLGFTPEDSDAAIAAILWPIIRGIIATAIENRQHLIIEGCYILPHHLAEFEDEYAAQIISVFLGFSDDYIMHHFETGIIKHRSAIENRCYAEDRPIEQFRAEHAALRNQAAACNVPYYEIDDSYRATLEQVMADIDRQFIIGA